MKFFENPKIKVKITLCTDPREENPLDSRSEIYTTVVTEMMETMKMFKEEVNRTKMASQLTSYRVLPNPLLQPYLDVVYTD